MNECDITQAEKIKYFGKRPMCDWDRIIIDKERKENEPNSKKTRIKL